MGMKQKFADKQFIDAVFETATTVDEVAERVGCSVSHARKRLNDLYYDLYYNGVMIDRNNIGGTWVYTK